MRKPVTVQGLYAWVVMMTVVGLAGCAQLEALGARRPTAEVAQVELKDITLQSIMLVFQIDVRNPYPVALPLVNLDYSVASRGTVFLSGKVELQGTVPASGTRRVPLGATVNLAEMMALIKDVRPGSVIPYAVEIGLSVDAPVAGTLRLPLKKEGRLPIPTVPQVDISEIRWEKVALDETRGVVRLRLVNRNEFAFDLSGLKYALSLGDVEVANSSIEKSVSFGASGGAGDIEIPISFSPEKAGMAVFRLIAGSGSGYTLRGEMALKTPYGPMSVPLDKTGRTIFRK